MGPALPRPTSFPLRLAPPCVARPAPGGPGAIALLDVAIGGLEQDLAGVLHHALALERRGDLRRLDRLDRQLDRHGPSSLCHHHTTRRAGRQGYLLPRVVSLTHQTPATQDDTHVHAVLSTGLIS